MNPFDYVTSIMKTKKNIMVGEIEEKAYSPFLTNRALSYYIDALNAAQEMNLNSSIDNKLQFHYLINKVRSANRQKVSWSKRKENSDIEAIREYFGYSYPKAKAALSVLTKSQIKEIKNKLDKGGN